MSSFTRYLKLSFDLLAYGPLYGFLNHLLREPEPLHPEILWEEIMRRRGPVTQWFIEHYPPMWMRHLLLWRKQRQSHISGIADHYDVSNDFYKLFLDTKYMFYTCADYRPETKTLEEAQTNKANALIELIEPKPGQKILELGCGWGAMLKAIHEATGDRENLHGFTLSKEQLEYNDEHNGFRVELRDFITTDYEPGEFDCIYSIGAWEHVRPRELETVGE